MRSIAACKDEREEVATARASLLDEGQNSPRQSAELRFRVKALKGGRRR